MIPREFYKIAIGGDGWSGKDCYVFACTSPLEFSLAGLVPPSMACQGKALMLNDLHPLTSFKRNSISKSSVKFVGNARRTFVLPSIFAFAFTNDVEME